MTFFVIHSETGTPVAETKTFFTAVSIAAWYERTEHEPYHVLRAAEKMQEVRV